MENYDELLRKSFVPLFHKINKYYLDVIYFIFQKTELNFHKPTCSYQKPNICCEIYDTNTTYKFSNKHCKNPNTTEFSVKNVTSSAHFSKTVCNEVSFEVSDVYKKDLMGILFSWNTGR